MNRHTFADVAAGKHGSLANDLDVDNDAEEEGAPISKRMRSAVEGEEEGSVRHVRDDDGEEFEAFNLKEEREGELGHFDETGNYVFKKGAEEDAWLAGMDETEIEKSIGEAAAAKQRLDKASLKAQQEIDAKSAAHRKESPHAVRLRLVQFMQEGETVAGTLRRLSGVKAKVAAEEGFVRRTKKTTTAAAAAPAVAPPSAAGGGDGAALLVVTELANTLLSAGLHGVYDMHRSHLWASCWRWEYKDPTGALRGPFTAREMGGWKAAGYFTGEGAVPMRRLPPSNKKITALYASIETSAASSSSSSSSASRGALAGGVVGDDSCSRKRKVSFAAHLDGAGGGADLTESGGQAPAKKARTVVEDLMADMESSDEEKEEERGAGGAPGHEGRDERIYGAGSSAFLVAGAVQQGYAHDTEWVSSDSVDFGSNFDEGIEEPGEEEDEEEEEEEEEEKGNGKKESEQEHKQE